MNVAGDCIIGAPKAVVWAAVNRVDLLHASIPGCQELQEDENGRLKAIVKLKMGIVSATLKGVVTFENINPPRVLHDRWRRRRGRCRFRARFLSRDLGRAQPIIDQIVIRCRCQGRR